MSTTTDTAPTDPSPHPRSRRAAGSPSTTGAPRTRRSGSRSAARRPPQPDLVDLLRAPRLLGLAAVVGQRGDAARVGFDFTVSQLFVLVAIPNLVGALIRLPYTFAVPKFGGRNWTVVSASLLLVPTLLFAWAVQHAGDAVLGVLPDRRDGRPRRRQLRQLDGQHQLLLPAAQEGHRARPQRGRRQHRRGLHPVLPADHRRRRGSLRAGPGERRAAPRAGRLPLRRPRGRRRPSRPGSS